MQSILPNLNILIIVDYREQSSETVRELLEMGVKIEYANLPVGDYLISERIVVERKTFNDFINSIIDKRLFEQARLLLHSYNKPIILIEGKNQIMRNISEEAIRGAIVSLIMDFNIPILWAKDAHEAAKFIVALAKREKSNDLRTISLKDRRRARTSDELREYIVASLPMVELTTARRLLSKFGSVERVFTASESELMKVKGIGPKKAKRIRSIISGQYGAKSSYGVSSPSTQSERK
ncbi:MAG: helix-hairpin-helix domain-containing protein [Candidatus Methanomethyliaceae archaeon]|nr:helix-hairpin-helix domain-containing protein [Candidatus Methanomethyliaceae archaeon]